MPRSGSNRFALALVGAGVVIAATGVKIAFEGAEGQLRAVSEWRDPVSIAGSSLIRLSVPRLGVERYVIDGASESNLRIGPARLSGTGLPGVGNFVIAGHRDTHFRFLKNLWMAEEIFAERSGKVHRYRLRSVHIVDPEDVSWVHPSDDVTLTLITCYPFFYIGAAPKRYVVRAEYLGSYDTRRQ